METYKSVFVICRNGSRIDDGENYAAHGSVGGIEDAIGYGTLQDARKFLTQEEAQAYIDQKLPAWGRSMHHPAEVFPWDLFFASPILACYLRHGNMDIPADLLEPPKGRLLVWRR